MNTTYYISPTSGAPVYTSRTVRRIVVGRPDFPMCYGDRISVRMTIDGRPAMHYETRQAADMTDLIGDLRRRARGMRGLAIVDIRNHDRGWTRERRIMLYPQRKHTPAQPPKAVQVPMFFPWEI